MNFTIEVPGEATPLTRESLYHALQTATSNDFAQRQAGGQQLNTWEQTPGYHSSLQDIYLDRSCDSNVRFLSIILLKNGIDKFWRTQVRNTIISEERALIRSRLFQGTINESERILALHNARVVAKVIRHDWPADWPEALSSIIGLLRSGKNANQQQLFGALQILYCVVKELSAVTLRSKKTQLQSIAPETVYVLNEIYADKSASWLSFLRNSDLSEIDVSLAMTNSLFALKILRRLIIFGYAMPHTDSSVGQFWTLSQTQFGQLLVHVGPESVLSLTVQEVIGRHLLQFAKFHIHMAENHAASFPFLPNSIPLVRAYWDLVSKFAETFDKSDGIRQGAETTTSPKAKIEGPLQERLALKGLLLFRACVRIAFLPSQALAYRSPEARSERARARNEIITELWKDDLVIHMVNSIITNFFVLRRSDLDLWEEDPEEWEQQEQSESNAYEWEVRPCAERLFLDLLTHFKRLIIPPLLAYFQTAQSAESITTTKEAVYTAMGLAAAHVFKEFDFDAVLTSTIAQDAQKQGSLCRVLRRRIAILISNWAPVRLADSSRPLVYQIFNHFLNPGDETNDLVVRITAARQLKWIADEQDFSVESFLPYTANVFSQLVQLMHRVELDETKLAILESVRILVIRMEEQVSQFGDELIAALPNVWENAGSDGYMIRQAVVAIFTALVTSMGSNSQRYQPLMIPLISEAAQPGSELHLQLIDEAIELWDAILTQSKAPLSPEVIDIAHWAVPLLEYDPDTAARALGVLESYLLIAPSAMLENDMRRTILVGLTNTLDSRSRAHIRHGIECIDLLLRAATELGGSNGISVMVQGLHETGFMHKIMSGLRDLWEAHQTTGPNKKVSMIDSVTEGHYLAVLARLALADPSIFMQMLSGFGDLDQVWKWLSSEWFSYTFSMDDPARQKLYLFGLTRLLELSSPIQELVLTKLQDYFDMWTLVIIEVQEGDFDGPDTLICQSSTEVTDYDTPRSIVAQETKAKDPVHSVPVLSFISTRLQELVARVGGEAVFEGWLSNVDEDVLVRFREIANAASRS